MEPDKFLPIAISAILWALKPEHRGAVDEDALEEGKSALVSKLAVASATVDGRILQWPLSFARPPVEHRWSRFWTCAPASCHVPNLSDRCLSFGRIIGLWRRPLQPTMWRATMLASRSSWLWTSRTSLCSSWVGHGKSRGRVPEGCPTATATAPRYWPGMCALGAPVLARLCPCHMSQAVRRAAACLERWHPGAVLARRSGRRGRPTEEALCHTHDQRRMWRHCPSACVL